jgi:hypothetical protein
MFELNAYVRLGGGYRFTLRHIQRESSGAVLRTVRTAVIHDYYGKWITCDKMALFA